VRRLRVPLTQVLYVDVRQGPVVRVLGLSRVRVGTLGSAHDVGPLAPDVADEFARHLAAGKN
jgi:membrane protein YdbS with pleckstrin-like domain